MIPNKHAGRPMDSTTKYHKGSIWGGSIILDFERSEKHEDDTKVKNIILECGECGSIYSLPYPNFTHIANHTDKVTCGCVLSDAIIDKTSTTELEKMLNAAAINASVSYMKTERKIDKRDAWLIEIIKAYKVGNYENGNDEAQEHKDKIISGIRVALMTSHLTDIVRDSLKEALSHAEAINV